MANNNQSSDDDRMHGRSREVKHVVNQMSDVDFFDYRLVVRSSGIQELMAGHSGLRQGLLYVESLVEELRSGNYGVAHALLLRSLEVFENSYNQIRRALVELGEYYDDHPTEVREINHGLTEMCDGCDNLVKAMVALRQTKTGESLEMSRRALTHLRESAHRIGSHLRDIKDCCPSNIEFEVMDIRENETRAEGGIEGARPVEMTSCHSSHGPGEPCDQKPVEVQKTDGKKNDNKNDNKNENTKRDGKNEDRKKDEARREENAKEEQRKAELKQHQEVVARLVEQLEDKHVPLDKIAEAVTAADPADVKNVPLMSRDLHDESAMEELMRKVSENRAKTIDRLVADARAAKAEAIADTNYVPTPGEQVPGMQPMTVKTGPMQAAGQVVDVQAKLSKAKKAEKGGKQSKKNLEKALEKAKEKAKRPPRKIGSKSETSLPAASASEKKKKKDEDLNELTFDDTDLDFNKAGKTNP